MNDAWPETVNGWELAREGRIENYRKRLANRVTVTAIWENGTGRGQVDARTEPLGGGRTLTSSRKDFRDKEAFWTAATCVLEMAANLPSLDWHTSPAPTALAGTVAGMVEAEPGTSGYPEAELTFTLTDGHTVTLFMTDEQAFDLSNAISRLDHHVWSEEREDDEEDEDEEEDDEFEESDVDIDGVPDVEEVVSGPDTGHDLVTLLDDRFGVTEDDLLAHVDWSALIVVGEPAVGSLIERGDELTAAVAPRWYPVVADRPGERWVVLKRTGLRYHGE
ncbi:hypothetical protein CFP71_18820 [Amycolatopsis thailandensis]|uniref:Uncharacterized protein n=1 Tax=Amycolatopsis thailandensis TaxID=589330 RepID=A0A229S860_9PSEU|nr:hypothetical protein [Amycolatopsis thailandensis]OXM54879.1 hypothetical protein CFP71_18820 [Amycolatopsis thailandensis]